MDNVNGTIDQLYLGDYKPQAIETKWPKLAADKRYQYLKAHRDVLLDVWTAVDREDEYVNFETNYETNRKWAVLYGINQQTVTEGGTYAPNDTKLAFLSSANLSSFYQLTRNDKTYNNHLTIEQWHFLSRNIKDATRNHGHTATYYNSTFKKVCAVGNDQIFIQKPGSSAPCTPLDWPVLTGFVANGHFYLFGESYIFSFSEEAYTSLNRDVSLKKVPFNEFIRCGGDGDSRGLGVSKKQPISLGLLIAIILIVVILILCCILCLIREAMARRKKKKGKHGKHESGGGGAWNPFSTARSSGLAPFGALSGKKASHSHHSSPGTRRSEGAIAGKQLTRKGTSTLVGPSGTRRSGGLSGGPSPLTGVGPGPTKRSVNNPTRAGSLSRGQKGTTLLRRNSTGHTVTGVTRKTSAGSIKQSYLGNNHTRRSGAMRKNSPAYPDGSNRATERSRFKKR